MQIALDPHGALGEMHVRVKLVQTPGTLVLKYRGDLRLNDAFAHALDGDAQLAMMDRHTLGVDHLQAMALKHRDHRPERPVRDVLVVNRVEGDLF